jgi:hypothetical protein
VSDFWVNGRKSGAADMNLPPETMRQT